MSSISSVQLQWIMNDIQWLLECDGIIISVFAVILLMFSRHRYIRAGQNLIVAITLNTLILFSDLLAVQFEGVSGALAHNLVAIGNYGVYLFQHLLLVFMCLYVYEKIAFHDPAASKKWVYAFYVMFGIFLVGLILNPFFKLYFYVDENNLYHRGPLFVYTMISGAVAIFLQTSQVFRNRKIMDREEVVVLLSYFAFPAIGLVIQIFILGYSFMNVGMTVSVIFVLIEYFRQQRVIREEKDRKLMLSRTYLLLSQIKPHFLFNSLSVIQSLIGEDPETAEIALGHFSKYLRKNLKLELSESTVSIKEEMDHVHNYLYIQKIRFGEKLQIRYEVDDSLDFQIPFLTIQPMVENAIGHGIRKKVEGGTVLIRIYDEDDWNIIQVIDDGVGFDPTQMPEKGTDVTLDPNSNGIGTSNVKERLQLLCQGEMQIQSVIGMGTTITIRIPKEVN